MEAILTVIRGKQQHFTAIGQAMMTNFTSGVRSGDTNVRSAFIRIISGALTSIRNKYNDFYNVGRYLVEGVANGISSYTYRAEARAAAMARASARAAERELDINSPSKVGGRIGGFFGQGFVNEIDNYADKAYKSGASMADSARKGLNDAIAKARDAVDSSMDVQPTIRPVLDLSEVQSNAGRLSAILSRSHALHISSSMSESTGSEIQNGVAGLPAGNTYQFTQNNYSPKALSRIEIYRQTKNQFSTLKGLVEA